MSLQRQVQEKVLERLGRVGVAARQAVHRLRVRYRELLREEIARTVESPSEIDDEIRHLKAVLGRR